jgi:hypothetical protein
MAITAGHMPEVTLWCEIQAPLPPISTATRQARKPPATVETKKYSASQRPPRSSSSIEPKNQMESRAKMKLSRLLPGVTNEYVSGCQRNGTTCAGLSENRSMSVTSILGATSPSTASAK